MTSKTEELQKLYQEVLDYKSDIDDDGDVRFRHPEMGVFYLSIDADNDPEFLRLVFPNFADDERTGLSREQLLELANEVNIRNKASKLTVSYMNSDNTWNVSAQIESFIAAADQFPDPEMLRATMNRNISAIRASLSTFHQAVEEAKNTDSEDGENGDAI